MIQLDEKKLARLRTTNQQLNEKYGEHGTDTREKFNEKSMAWYYGDILRERRKELKLTQKQLAPDRHPTTYNNRSIRQHQWYWRI